MAAVQAVPSIPVLRHAHDPMSEGVARSLKHEAMKPHTVETIQSTHAKHAWDADLFRVSSVYGMHAAWEKRMDRAVLSTVQRLPGGPSSSFVALDKFLRRDSKMDFEDSLNLPEYRTTAPRLSVHELVERRLGF